MQERLALQPDAPIPATWALVALLVLVHLGTGLWAWSMGLAEPWAAFFGERSEALRAAVGGQHASRLGVGEGWRLASSVLLHVSALHLVVNAVALVVLGRLGEPLVGAARWMAVFVAGGVVGSIGSHLLGVLQSDGASGGAFGGLGLLIAVGLRWRGELAPDDARLLGPILIGLALLNLAVGVFVPALDLAAHLGGLLAGLVLGGRMDLASSARPWWAVVAVFSATVGYGWWSTAGA